MESENTQGATGGEVGEAGGRSSDEQPPAAGRGAGAAEIEDGAAVDEIAACIGAGGDESSGSADDRFTARIEGLVEAQREVGTRAAEWAKGREPDAGKRTGLFVIESVRTQALLKIADLTEREEPVSTEELARLALALYRIEDADRRRVAREQAAADMPTRPAERKLPSQEELTAILHKTIKEQFFPGRLGVPPWKDGWDAPSPADSDSGATPPDPPSGSSVDSSAGDAGVARGEGDAHDSEGARDAQDVDHAQDTDHVRGEPDEGDAGDAHDTDHACRAQDVDHARKAQDVDHARRARDAHDPPDAHIARHRDRWAWGGEFWPPEIPLSPSEW